MQTAQQCDDLPELLLIFFLNTHFGLKGFFLFSRFGLGTVQFSDFARLRFNFDLKICFEKRKPAAAFQQ